MPDQGKKNYGATPDSVRVFHGFNVLRSTYTGEFWNKEFRKRIRVGAIEDHRESKLNRNYYA